MAVLHERWVWWLFAAAVLENLIPPIPSEVVMPRGWYLASIGKMNFLTAVFIGTIWSTLGSVPYYFLGKFLSKDKINKFVDKYWKYIFIKSEDVDNIYQIYQKNGWKLTFFGRFLPLGRGFVGLPAGSTGMSFWKYFAYTFAGTLVWVNILVYIWYTISHKIDSTIVNDASQISSRIKIIEYISIGVVAILVLSWLLNHFGKKYFKVK